MIKPINIQSLTDCYCQAGNTQIEKTTVSEEKTRWTVVFSIWVFLLKKECKKSEFK